MNCALSTCRLPLTPLQIKKGCRYHTNSCAKRGRAAPRPLCKWCAHHIVKRKGAIYCSRECNGAAQRPHTKAMLEANRAKHHARVWREVIADVQSVMEAAAVDGRLVLADAVKAGVKVAVKHRRIAYSRGYGTRWHQELSKNDRQRRMMHAAWRRPA